MKYQSVNDEISFFDSIENNKKKYPISFFNFICCCVVYQTKKKDNLFYPFYKSSKYLTQLKRQEAAFLMF